MINKLFNKVITKYKNNPEDILNLFFIFVITPILLTYFYGLKQGTFIFFTIVIVAGVLPFIINLIFNYFFYKEKITKYFFLLIVIYFIWLFMAYFYMNSKYIVFTFIISVILFIMLKFVNYLKK